MGRQRFAAICLGVAAALWSLALPANAQPVDEPYEGTVPAALRGPFISDPEVIALLDQVSPKGCGESGALVFGCLFQGQARMENQQAFGDRRQNPFRLAIADDIVEIISDDVDIAIEGDGRDARRLPTQFLTSPYARVELVGIVNRMDRQFVHDQVPAGGGKVHDGCGEISVIYRFSYLRGAERGSRLPVTMNIVFPAIPTGKPAGAATCADIARRWIAEMEKPPGRSPLQVVSDLQNPATGVLASISGQDIFRIEINMQAYRIPVADDLTGLGSTAKYVMRVFRWNPTAGKFTVSHMANQIDRARLLGDVDGDENSCTRDAIPGFRDDFLAWMRNEKVLADLDYGVLNIPDRFLACRAISGSPGGQYRSLNQPFWQAMPDDAIQDLIDYYREVSATPFSFVQSVDDVRTRLNDLSCSGCHQARAIAGFHFPGADRSGTPSFNAVLLPGSPHFYGDQPRRRDILEAFLGEDRVTTYELATSYAARPLNSYREQLKKTNLIGGWGAACLVDWEALGTQRQWGCEGGLQCKPVFGSSNAPNLGTCLPPEGTYTVGDPLQFGSVESTAFGSDAYQRLAPEGDSTLIEVPRSLTDPEGNSFYAAHQEYYRGIKTTTTRGKPIVPTTWKMARDIRDAQTGGFPGGMLRLSECINLPGEATCGLTAANGFNSCINDPTRKVTDCFLNHTAYAGLRACDAATPCRDDYICLQPITGRLIAQRSQSAAAALPYRFGVATPDDSWLSRFSGAGDQRGYCMPPYFVLQFRVDGHPEQ